MRKWTGKLIDWDKYEMQEGLKPIPDNHPQAKYLKIEKDRLASLPEEAKQLRKKVIDNAVLVERVYEKHGVGVENYKLRQAELKTIKEMMKNGL